MKEDGNVLKMTEKTKIRGKTLDLDTASLEEKKKSRFSRVRLCAP